MVQLELTAIVAPGAGTGHGESFLWQAAHHNQRVVIDAGGTNACGTAAAAFNPSILILSHDDKDHIGGAVNLINGASHSLQELWMPAEWSILIHQIANTDPVIDNEELPDQIDLADVETRITRSLAEGEDELDPGPAVVARAVANLESWAHQDHAHNANFTLLGRNNHRYWYGATDLNEIVQRVRKRAVHLCKILEAAYTNNVARRFFSIDMAIHSRDRTWETNGRLRVVTIANAVEVEHWDAITIPPGILYSYALSKITVQNRRALSTLLWTNPNDLNQCVCVWSDTDGDWIRHIGPRGIDTVLSNSAGYSAPHHASNNPAHDRVWNTINRNKGKYAIICAGGQRNQGYRQEYVQLAASRSCTWCRPHGRQIRPVTLDLTNLQNPTLTIGCNQVH